MDLAPAEDDLFTAYLAQFTDLAGDVRTKRLLSEIIHAALSSHPVPLPPVAYPMSYLR